MQASKACPMNVLSQITDNIILTSSRVFNNFPEGYWSLNIQDKELDPPPQTTYKFLKLKDSFIPQRNVSVAQYEEEVKQIIKEGIEFIDKCISSGNKICVNCECGISRSPTIVIAYLMYKNGWSYDKTYKFVEQKRYCIQPNMLFVKILKKMQ